MKISNHTLIGVVLAAIATVTAGTMFASGSLGIGQESRSSSSADIASLSSGVMALCPAPDSTDRQACLEKGILALVQPYGPIEAMDTLKKLLADGTVHGHGDYHDFVHRIGRATAKKMGLNPDGFFECPVDFNYGCQHGFFEQALVEEPDAKKAAEMICDESKMSDRPLKFFFYCYHGVGHGVMMAKAYDLPASLNICNEFTEEEQRTGCYQGAFMENVVGFNNGTVREGVFLKDDPLAPCNRVAAMYRFQCYINMGGYLAGRAGNNPGAMERAAEPCLKAGDHVRTCLRSVGLTSTNPAWQPQLTPEFGPNLVENALSICKHFPKGYEVDCVTAAIDNLAQFDRGDTKQMVQFCSGVDDQYKNDCYRHIGNTVQNELPAGATQEQVCTGVPEQYRATCAQGMIL